MAHNFVKLRYNKAKSRRQQTNNGLVKIGVPNSLKTFVVPP